MREFFSGRASLNPSSRRALGSDLSSSSSSQVEDLNSEVERLLAQISQPASTSSSLSQQPETSSLSLSQQSGTSSSSLTEQPGSQSSPSGSISSDAPNPKRRRMKFNRVEIIKQLYNIHGRTAPTKISCHLRPEKDPSKHEAMSSVILSGNWSNLQRHLKNWHSKVWDNLKEKADKRLLRMEDIQEVPRNASFPSIERFFSHSDSQNPNRVDEAKLW